MWLDDNLVLCEDDEFYGAASTDSLFGDIVDLGQFDSGKPKLSSGSPAPDNITDNPNFGGVMPMTLLFRITEAMAGGTSVNFKLYSDNTLNGTYLNAYGSIHWQTGPIALAAATKGREFIVPIPWDSATPVKRYLQIGCDLVGTSTAGKVSAMLLVGAHQWEAMRGNYVQV